MREGRREARAGQREYFDASESPMGQAYSLGEVYRSCQIGCKPVPKPSGTGKGGKDLAVHGYWWGGGTASGVSLKRSPAVNEFGPGDTKAYLTSPSTGPDLPECSL